MVSVNKIIQKSSIKMIRKNDSSKIILNYLLWFWHSNHNPAEFAISSKANILQDSLTHYCLWPWDMTSLFLF